jgi:hypothetical protein
MTTHAPQGLRIAFYSPRASHLEPTLAHGGDPIFLEALLGALRERGHEVRIVSRLNVRDLWRGRVPARRLIREAIRVWRNMREFSPDAWLVYNPSRTYPDVFGWWQRPTRYVLLNAHTWQSKRMPQPWQWLFEFAFRRALKRADSVVAARPATAMRLRNLGATDSQIHVLPPGVSVEPSLPPRAAARRRLNRRRRRFSSCWASSAIFLSRRSSSLSVTAQADRASKRRSPSSV